MNGSQEKKLTDNMISIMAFFQAHPDGQFFADEVGDNLSKTAKQMTPVLTRLTDKGYLEKESFEREVVNSKGEKVITSHKKYWISKEGKKISL